MSTRKHWPAVAYAALVLVLSFLVVHYGWPVPTDACDVVNGPNPTMEAYCACDPLAYGCEAHIISTRERAARQAAIEACWPSDGGDALPSCDPYQD